MTQQEGSSAIPNQPHDEDHADELSLLDLALVLARHKKKIIGVPLLAGVAACYCAFQIEPTYTASIKFSVPSQSSSSAAALLGQMGPLAGMALGGAAPKSNSELFLAILKSRPMADIIIADHNLIQHYKLEKKPKKKTDARTILAKRATGKIGRLDGIITWEVVDTDPVLAATLANDFAKELGTTILGLAVTEASHRRIFLEKQLRKSKGDLLTAEGAFKQMQETTGIISLDEQGKALLTTIATIQTQIIEREVELGTLRLSATDKNPEVVRVQQAIAGMRTQLSKLENSNTNFSSAILATSKVPQAGLEYLRAMRELKYQETIFEIVARQYEVARADESKDAPAFQVIESAIPPEYKTAPKKAQIAAVSTFVAGILTVFFAFLWESKARAATNPRIAGQYKELAQHFKLR